MFNANLDVDEADAALAAAKAEYQRCKGNARAAKEVHRTEYIKLKELICHKAFDAETSAATRFCLKALWEQTDPDIKFPADEFNN